MSLEELEKIQNRIKNLEEQINELDKRQKQDADECIGFTKDLLHKQEEIEEKIEELEQEIKEQNAVLELKYFNSSEEVCKKNVLVFAVF